MTLSRINLFVPLLILVLVAGCAGYARMTDQARPAIFEGRFEDALTAFPERSARGKDEVLIRLERAVLLQAMGRFDESSREFELASARIRKYEDRAVLSAGRTASQAGSIILNEQVRPYEGQDFEKILVHSLDALNYLMKGDLEGAGVEVRNAYARQNELYEKHAEELEKAGKDGRGVGWEDSFSKADKDRYDDIRKRSGTVHSVYQNAFAYYLSSLVYELQNEKDEAYIDLKKGIMVAPESKSMQRDLVRLSRDLSFREDMEKWEASFGKPEDEYGKGVDVFVIFQHGVAPVKEALNFPIPLPRGGLAFASIPVYRFIPSAARSCEVSSGSRTLESSAVSDTDAIASKNLLDKLPILFGKQIVRSYLKARMTNKLSKDYGAVGAISGTLASVITEQADLRTWACLPKEIQTARVYVPEATGEVAVKSIPSGRMRTVRIPEGTRHLIVLIRDTDAGLALQTKAY